MDQTCNVPHGGMVLQVHHHRGEHQSPAGVGGSRRTADQSPGRLGHTVRHAHRPPAGQVPQLPD